ncbi:MAG: OOP family OmpA-OmpF porin [Polaribacter sp.]|jgi:OOP family OmpA-OmpF porin
MNVFLKRWLLICFSVLVSACTIPQTTLLKPIPIFSHSSPIRVVQSNPPLQRRIQSAVVYFANDSYKVSPDAKKVLAEFLDQFTDPNLPSIVLEGHTDSNGSEVYNMNLSKQRTLSVKKTITQSGHPGGQIIEVAKGEFQPVVSNASPSGLRLNRRVVVKPYQE